MQMMKPFHETDRATLVARIREWPLGLIVGVGADGRPVVTQAPVLVDISDDAVVIRFHLFIKNELVEAMERNGQGLCVFSGPDAYISPDWYDLPDQVPTWNYQSVEAEGKVRRLDEAELTRLLDDLSDHFERCLLPKPVWTRAKMTPGKFESMLGAIVGFEMRVTDLRGTSKLNQNKPPAARDNVITALGDHPIARAMKNLP
jgi:transcriptional regulator